jgi:hypothetical protein
MNLDDLYYECPPGWRSIVDPVVKALELMGVEVLQVKEKFGGLRLYVTEHDDFVNGMIRGAEEICANRCQMCGTSPAKLVNRNNWLSTVCNECNK